jgi:hypothetical protein
MHLLVLDQVRCFRNPERQITISNYVTTGDQLVRWSSKYIENNSSSTVLPINLRK